MQFAYHEQSGAENLEVSGELFSHLFSARRAQQHDTYIFRNLQDNIQYEYIISDIQKKSARLSLHNKIPDAVSKVNAQRRRIGWCVIDTKTIEKTIPLLNELGVDGIDFIYAHRSQRNFKPDSERLRAILIASCCQCGRSTLMDFRLFADLSAFIATGDSFDVCDFGGIAITSLAQKSNTVVIGPEGGFTAQERGVLQQCATSIISLPSPYILKSETAAVCAAALYTI